MRIFNIFLAILTASEHGNIVHRAGSIERNERDDVAEIGGSNGGQRLAHAFRFQLEHADCVTPLKKVINRRIVPTEDA